MSNCNNNKTPTAMSPRTPHSSLYASRTGTPATATYESASSSRTASPDSSSAGSAGVKHALVVDWDVDLPVDTAGRLGASVAQTLQLPNASRQSPGMITCVAETDGGVATGVKIRVDLGYAANVELRVFGQAEATTPFINLHSEGRDVSEFHLSARTLHPILTSSSTSTRATAPILLSFSIAPSKRHPAPSIYESTSPSALHRLSGYLDQPGGHDVVFCFPDNKQLYADRYILQRCSPYFRRLFQTSPQRGVAVKEPAATPTQSQSHSRSQSCSESPKTQTRSRSPSTAREGEGASEHDSPGSTTFSDEGFESEDITLQNFDDVLTPGTSVPPSSGGGDNTHGFPPDPSRIPLPRDAGSPPSANSYSLQRTPSPLVDDNIFVIEIKETSLNTMRAVLYYLYTDFISFAPLTSCFHNIHPLPAKSGKSPRSEADDDAVEKRRLDARNAVVGEYMRRHPSRPVPVSPKSVYAIAKKYEIPALENQSLLRITMVAEADPIVAISELFSAFSRVHTAARQPQLETVIASWEKTVRRSGEWEVVRAKGAKVADAYFSGILCEILDRLP